MVLEVGIDGRGSRGSYSLGLIKSRDGSPVRAVEPSDCRITAYREEIAEEISGLVPFLPPPHEINCANRIVRPAALPNGGRATRSLCVSQRGKSRRTWGEPQSGNSLPPPPPVFDDQILLLPSGGPGPTELKRMNVAMT
jgi:hypothetical protein